ncbi:MAG: hypothetical protein ACTSYB_12015 [Candidatus Helarchaeota archaeon]
MKQITISVLHPDIFKVTEDPITVTVDDNADIIQAIAAADRIFHQLCKGDFPVENLSSLLQFVWDVKSWNFFVDVGVEARAPDKTWLPLRDDPTLNLPPGAEIKLNPDAGC